MAGKKADKTDWIKTRASIQSTEPEERYKSVSGHEITMATYIELTNGRSDEMQMTLSTRQEQHLTELKAEEMSLKFSQAELATLK